MEDKKLNQYPKVKDLLEKMLMKFPQKRISALEAMQHDFFSDYENIEDQIQINLEGLIQLKEQAQQKKTDSNKDSFVTREKEINGKMDTVNDS